jgi:plasmid segregation protein ParM
MIQSPYLSGTAVTEGLLVPVDTGNKQIKTPRHIFTAGLTCHDSYPPFGKDVIQYKGKYYTLSDQRVPYMRDKTADERYFILSLFGIACEVRAYPQAYAAITPMIAQLQGYSKALVVDIFRRIIQNANPLPFDYRKVPMKSYSHTLPNTR